MRVIFLDVDGVLNNGRAFKESHRLGCLGCGTDALAYENMKRFRELYDAVDAKVVLSSTWREFPEANRLIRCALFSWGIPVYDQTPIIDCFKRGEEIYSWMEHQPEKIESYVILDDLEFDFAKWCMSEHHVKTNDSHGLCLRHVREAIKILS